MKRKICFSCCDFIQLRGPFVKTSQYEMLSDQQFGCVCGSAHTICTVLLNVCVGAGMYVSVRAGMYDVSDLIQNKASVCMCV